MIIKNCQWDKKKWYLIVCDIVIKPGLGVNPVKRPSPEFYGSTRDPGPPIKPGLFKGKVRLKIRNGEGRQWSGIHVAVMLSLVLWREKAQLISLPSPHKFYLPSLTSSQATKLSFFFEPSVLCRDEHDLLKPKSTVLAHVASLSLLKLWVWSTPPLDDQDLLTKRKRVSEELRLLLQIRAIKRKNKIVDQLLDWIRLNNETDRTLLEDLSEEQGRIPFEYLIYSFLPSLRLTFQLQSSYQPFLSHF
jgi:hypothetical protein